ncbi:MAG: FAD:protein FMN transferase, partial [Myxococcales bacterium]|nr:FAD:protein FMN transferase [Myxococcales bacterium]
AAFAEVARVEAVMSEWRPSSEVSRLNAAGGAPVTVSAELFELLQRARDLGDRSGGAFDVTWAALRGVWDFDAGRVPAPDAVAAAQARIDYRRLTLDPAARTATLPAGMAVGLGGIAKGYGIDRAAAVLRARGFTAFLVDGGGDLYVAGEKAPGQPWTVGVQHPRRRDELMVALPVRDAAVVTSGDYERYFEAGGRRYHHIIDPRTGMPAERSVAVTVRAADATFADALATALFVMGPEAGIALAEALPGVDAAVLAADGRVVATPGLRAAFPARWQEAR